QARLASLLPAATAIHTAPTLRKAFDVAARAARAAARERKKRLATPMRRSSSARGRLDTAAPAPDASLLAGEIAVLRMPNAARDLDTKTARPRLNVLGGLGRVARVWLRDAAWHRASGSRRGRPREHRRARSLRMDCEHSARLRRLVNRDCGRRCCPRREHERFAHATSPHGWLDPWCRICR